MVHGAWCMVYGAWMVHGAWCMVRINFGASCVVRRASRCAININFGASCVVRRVQEQRSVGLSLMAA